ncbi:NAD(P)H-dependent flavin oxidoreductase [Oceanimonas baumannii]|uniref:Nitronate monooxygenase n=1 Tax=Oceanimonas baumannii TaxID=129578 RepID=A0A235C9U7_9GAMM|nr:nitronate monooxygenase [Oceanimonas baumannii]OYD21398.1 nitronate monooxygenase [Oceanimonas baumannii]TDW56382.1 nitronate monooxygenase [Oceanimonas baumannii]
MSSHSELLALLGIRYPLIQAPMAGLSTPTLAAAVSNAGGLGSLGLGASSVADARRQIEQTRQLTDKPFNTNVFCHAPARRDARVEAAWLQHLQPFFDGQGEPVPAQLEEIYTSFNHNDAMQELLLELRPAVVSFHFGLPPAPFVERLHRAGVTTLASATSLEEARAIETAGIHGVVAQGIEAGGHRGMFDPGAHDNQLSTAGLVSLLVKECRLPVIAAGGIMDGEDIQAMLALGAAAVQLGTAFVACPESAANEAYRQRLMNAGETRLTRTLSGRPARGLLNRLIEHGEAEGAPVVPDYPVAYDAAKRLHGAAARQGCDDFAAHWAGTGVQRTRALPADELVKRLLNEAGVRVVNGAC